MGENDAQDSSAEQGEHTPMTRNYFIHKRRRAKYSSVKSAQMNKARWDADRARREEEMPERMREIEEWNIQNLPRKQGDALGCLQWHDFRTGKVRRWTIRIGDRADRITMEAGGIKTRSYGWTWIMNAIRSKIVTS